EEARPVALRRFDLDDVGAVGAEQHRAIGRGDALPEIEHAQAPIRRLMRRRQLWSGCHLSPRIAPPLAAQETPADVIVAVERCWHPTTARRFQSEGGDVKPNMDYGFWGCMAGITTMNTDGIVLVTGGSRGIGAATAALLAGQGKKVVITDIAPEPIAGGAIL